MVGTTETTYVWDWVESGANYYYYFGGRKVAAPCMAMRNGTVTYLYADHLTSTTNTNGAQTSSQLYYPYGDKRGTNSVVTPYRYTGQRWEDALGLYFYQARWYDSALGRFLQPDTLVPEPGNPQALNRYSYCLNDPVNRNDPTGHWGPKVHFLKTGWWTLKINYEVRLLTVWAALDVKQPVNDAAVMAMADIGVDIRASLVGIIDWSLTDDEYRTARTPSEELGGAIPEQYYHYPSRADAIARLNAAIEAKDLWAFGRALHSYQDYFSHTLNGLTAPPGDLESLLQNCPECLDQGISIEEFMARAGAKGTDIYDWDEYNPATHPYAALMAASTQWYILLFYLNYFGITYEDYVAAYGVPDFAPESEEQ